MDLNLRAGDKNTAIRVLRPFANNPHELEYAAQVADLINALSEAGERRCRVRHTTRLATSSRGR